MPHVHKITAIVSCCGTLCSVVGRIDPTGNECHMFLSEIAGLSGGRLLMNTGYPQLWWMAFLSMAVVTQLKVPRAAA